MRNYRKDISPLVSVQFLLLNCDLLSGIEMKRRRDTQKGHQCNKAGQFNMYDLFVAGFLGKLFLLHVITGVLSLYIIMSEYYLLFLKTNV